ncbi:hypothetical protein LOK49_LG07G01996 [Camellia lanceoleosa]|uniref:Uncharacterized protein n=1 Tax=Camellia lanceoleosa TaxID=1840588 RepID=A0ACC0H771_9ERIC|nr:hypothetical protein LOK49_LG07G01996 [Camellia lanceoleosa]
MGCSRITSLSCPRPFDQKQYLVEVRNVSYFNLIDKYADKYAAFPNISDIDRYREICLLNCSCGVLFFRYNNNVLDGYCYIPSTIETIREGPIPNHSFASATFVKVQIPYKVANGQVEGTVPDNSPPASRRNLKAIIAGSCVGALLIFVVIIVTCFVMLCPSCSEDEDCMKQVPGSLVSMQSESRKQLLQVLRERAEYQLLDMVENMDEGVKKYHPKEVVRMIRIGAWCLQIDQSRRSSMSIVVKVLE